MIPTHADTTVWHYVTAANVVISLTYGFIGLMILRGLLRTGQHANILAMATAAIFLTCSLGHGLHVIHLMLPSLDAWGLPLGDDAVAEGNAMRVGMGDLHSVVVDVLTACAGLFYVLIRKRVGIVIGAPRLFDDLRERRQRGIEVNDNLIQGLTAAKMALEHGETEMAQRVLAVTLTNAKAMMGDLFGPYPPQPSDLVRQQAATVATSNAGSAGNGNQS